MEGRVGLRLMAAVMVMLFGQGSAALVKTAWAPGPTNLTEWASLQPFYVGVWIGFYFENNKHQYNVLQVNQTSFENCNDQDPIKNITRGGGRDVFELTEAKTYYFLSGGGYCWGGLKMAVNVHQFPPPPPASPPASPNGSGSAEAHVVTMLLPILFCLIAAISGSYF